MPIIFFISRFYAHSYCQIRSGKQTNWILIVTHCYVLIYTEGKRKEDRYKELTKEIEAETIKANDLENDLRSLHKKNKILVSIGKIAPYTGLLSTFLGFCAWPVYPTLAMAGVIGFVISFVGCEYVPRMNNQMVKAFKSKQGNLSIVVANRERMMKEKCDLETEIFKLRSTAKEVQKMYENATGQNSPFIYHILNYYSPKLC